MPKLQHLISIFLVLFSTTSTQAQQPESIDPEKYSLLLNLESLNSEAAKLDAPLARATAKAEIANAVWKLKQSRAQELLSEAYDLTLPDEEERTKLRVRSMGATPTEPSEIDLARSRIRHRILQIASKDQEFATRLSKKAATELGPAEECRMYGSLVERSVQSGDAQAAVAYAQHAIDSDPTQVVAGLSIQEVATLDRELADKLLIDYIKRLRSFPLSRTDAARVYFTLRFGATPNPNLDPNRRQIPPAGPEAARAYVSYVVESLTELELREPGSAVYLRSDLLSLWPLLNQHAPDLLGQFLAIEKVSRGSDASASLPATSPEDKYRTNYEERLKNAYESRNQRDIAEALNHALGRSDFTEARKLIDLVSEEKVRTQYLEDVNTRESIAFARAGEITAAEAMARRLQTPLSILRAYPFILAQCAAKKNSDCVTSLSRDAVKRLKRIDDQTDLARIFGELTKSVAPLDTALAFELLDETVKAANKHHPNTDTSNIDFDPTIFATLSGTDEARAKQSASLLEDRLQRIVSLAAVVSFKQIELTSASPARRSE